MYNKHFGFREKPFNVAPNPRLFYTNPVYQEAYAALVYGIRERKGFIVLTGEVGTGKTTVLRRLMDNLEATVRFVFVYNTSMSFDEILSYACDELGLTAKEDRRLRKIQALSEFLIEQLRKGGTAVLLIDEAQNLGDEALENLRLLSNLETRSEKLLQIVLVGQPELEIKLDQPKLRQIKQRVAVRYRLSHLREREISSYIDYRLRASGFQRSSLFSSEALQQIALYSKGVPRLINIICDNALLIAYASAAKQISGGVIKEVARDLHLESAVPTGQNAGMKVAQEGRTLAPKEESAAAKVEAVVPKAEATTPKAEPAASKVIRSREEALRVVKGKPQEETGAQSNNKEPATTVTNSVDATIRAWTEKILQGLDDLGSNSLARFAVGVFLAVLLLGGVASATLQNKERMQGLSVQAQKLFNLIGHRFGILKDNLDDLFASSTSSDGETEKIEASLVAESSATPVKKTLVEEAAKPHGKSNKPARPPNIQEVIPPKTKIATSTTAFPPAEWKGSSIVVKQGSTIREIAAHFYGPENLLLGMGLIKEFNPHINDLNGVSAGERILIPFLSKETLVRRHGEGLYRLIVDSFGSIMQAVEFAQAIRDEGYRVVIAPQRLSDTLLLHRVEIGGLENIEAVDRAWATAISNQWGALSDKRLSDSRLDESLNDQSLSGRKER